MKDHLLSLFVDKSSIVKKAHTYKGAKEEGRADVTCV